MPVHVGGKSKRLMRLLALFAALLLALPLLAAAGHAASHLGERTPCHECPVCLRLSALARSSFEALPLCALIALTPHAGRCLFGRFGQRLWPCLSLSTPVKNKIKLTI